MRVFYPPRKFYRTVLGLAFFALGELQGCAGTMVRDADSGADAASAGKVETLDVAVIGAGLSGLTAAFRLGAIAPPLHGKPALRIQVFEARPRLGGRVFTVMMNGQPVELGGQTFEDGGSASEIRSLVSELKLDTTVFRRPNRTSYGHHGEGIEPSLIQIYRDVMPQLPRIATAEAEEKVADLLEDLARSQTSLEPVIELFFTKLQQEAAGNLSRVKAYEILKNYSRARVMLYEGVPPAQLASTYATGSFLYMFLRTEKDYQKWLAQGSPADQEGSFTGTSVAGGNARLIDELARQVQAQGSQIHLGKVLVEVEQEAGGSYLLMFEDGQKVQAQIVVLTLPAPVYRSVRFVNHPIPEVQLRGIREVQYGPVGKILLPVQSSAPERLIGSVVTDDVLSWFNRDAVRDRSRGESVVTLYFTGNSHLLNLSIHGPGPHLFGPSTEAMATAARRLEMGLRLFQVAYPEIYPKMVPMTVKEIQAPEERQFSSYNRPIGINWATERFSMGGYSVISPAQVEVFSDDQKKEVLGQPVFALFEPVLPPLRAGHCPGGGIYFAGEHTATQETPATLEGAVHSGNKVGHQIPMRLEQVMECRRLSRIE